MNYQHLVAHLSYPTATRSLRDFAALCCSPSDRVRRPLSPSSTGFGSISGNAATVSRPQSGSITASISRSITSIRRENQRITPADAMASFSARSSLGFVVRSGLEKCSFAVSFELRGAEAPPDGRARARARCGLRRLPLRLDLGDTPPLADPSPLTRLAESARPTGGREPGRLVRRTAGLWWKAAAAVVLACAVPVALAAPAFGQSGPEPAPKQRTGPIPEPFPTAKPQPREVSPPAQPATPPAPPAPLPASPPPPAAPPPPPEVSVVAPPPSPPVLQSPPSVPRTAPPASGEQPRQTKGAKTTSPNRTRIGKPKRAAKHVLARVAEKRSSTSDGMLLAGGLALFVLVLAGTVLLTLSTRVLRVSG
jgi:hypothetical protein